MIIIKAYYSTVYSLGEGRCNTFTFLSSTYVGDKEINGFIWEKSSGKKMPYWLKGLLKAAKITKLTYIHFKASNFIELNALGEVRTIITV